jgi:hypothetical protein
MVPSDVMNDTRKTGNPYHTFLSSAKKKPKSFRVHRKHERQNQCRQITV